MLDLQAVGDGPDAGGLAGRSQAPERQQQLMLLRLEARHACCLLAEMEEPSNLVPKFRQRLIVLIFNNL
jgi:hypothetical protein